MTWLLWTPAGLVALLLANRSGVGYYLAVATIRRDRELARSNFQAARIRRRWHRLARNLGLALVDRTETVHGTGVAATPKVKVVHTVPRLRAIPDAYGVRVTLKTVPGVGLVEVQKASRHLSDAWLSVRVAVTQPEPGKLVVRAVRRDPLAVKTSFTPDVKALQAPTDLRTVEIGMDEYAEPVDIRLDGVSGIGIYGLPGAGKSSLINGLFVRLSPSPAVQFVVFDGKTDDPANGDYCDLVDRIAMLVGDDLDEANEVLGKLVEHRKARARSIRAVLGVKNVWHVGPSPDWPLIIINIDEAHTYFSQVKDGGDKELKARNAKAAQNVMLVEDLVKKGRSVGMLTILATQKGTGDAIPTQIRDVCAVSLAFACRTIEAAVAALGDDIRQYPEANPVGLQGEQYIGVCSMVVIGRPGYTRVRTPFVDERVTAEVAALTRTLVPARGQLPALRVPALTAAAVDVDGLPAGKDDDD